MATEMQKPEDKETHEELPKKTLETVPNKPSLTDHLDDSPNPSTHPSSLQESDEDPLTDGSGKERESPSTETPLGSSADLAAPISDLQKKILRAERFGMSVQLSEVEKRNSRAERFGTGSNLHGLDEIKKSEEQKKKKRAERFGLPTETAANEEAKKKARLARFAAVSKTDTLEEDKKKARAIRFSKPSSNAPSQLNGLGQTEQKTATVGKDSGGA